MKNATIILINALKLTHQNFLCTQPLLPWCSTIKVVLNSYILSSKAVPSLGFSH